jgi:hypothetical protein
MWSEARVHASHRLVARSPRGYTRDGGQIDNEMLMVGHRTAVGSVVVVAAASLNAFFAIPVNNPSIGIVNFSRCACAAPMPRAPDVIQSVAPPLRRAAILMEVGADARV